MMDVTSLTNATVLGTPRPESSGNTEMGKTEFLKLLMAQLQAQDPMNPMDSTQFVSQLSQFASLEQLTNLGSKMDSLLNVTTANNSGIAVSLLGKHIRVEGNEISGPSTVYYELKDNLATAVNIDVKDEAGNVVQTLNNQPTAKGLHNVKIEGLAPGKYTFEVHALDAENTELAVVHSVTEMIKAVSFLNGAPTLVTESGKEVSANEIVEIFQPQNQAGS